MLIKIHLNRSQAAQIPILFGPLGSRWPSLRNLGLSFCAHVGLVCALGSLSFTAPPPARPVRVTPDGTEIRIGDHLYYVARIAAPRESAHGSPGQGAAGKKSPSRGSAPPAVKPAERQVARRTFVPPEIKRAPVEQTLIQPDSAPAPPPVLPELPSFQTWTPQLIKVARPFVSPGHRVTIPEMPKISAPPVVDFVQAPPSIQTGRLTLPPVSAPIESPPDATVPQLPAGDPVNIFSMNDRAVALENLIHVPPGNVVAEDRPGVNGSGSGKGLNSSIDGSGDSASGRNSGNHGGGADSEGGAVAGAGKGSGTIGTGSGGSRAGAGAGGSGDGSAGSSGHGGGSSGGSGGNGAGGRGVPVASGGKSDGAAVSGVKQVVIIQPPGGHFDAIIVQSSPLDLFPEGRHLLSGRPIYTVYIAVGTAKEWALYFCVAGEKTQNSGQTGIVQLSAPVPVRPPYPTRIVRPEVSLPKYEKFLLLHAVLSETGRFKELRVVNPEVAETDQAVLTAVGSWTFLPADRDGVPVATEILLVIPAAGL